VPQQPQQQPQQQQVSQSAQPAPQPILEPIIIQSQSSEQSESQQEPNDRNSLQPIVKKSRMNNDDQQPDVSKNDESPASQPAQPHKTTYETTYFLGFIPIGTKEVEQK